MPDTTLLAQEPPRQVRRPLAVVPPPARETQTYTPVPAARRPTRPAGQQTVVTHDAGRASDAGRAPGRLARLWGGLAGALLGFIVYWGGALLAAIPDLAAMPGSDVPQTFLNPVTKVLAWEIAAVVSGAVVGAAVARSRWPGMAILAYVGLLCLLAGYLAYALTVSIPDVPPESRWLSYVLLAAETGGLSLIAVFSFYSLDAATRRRWARDPERHPFDPAYCPKVAFEVPVFNEPLEMVKETIAHLLRQDYPRDRYMVLVLDDSTDPTIRSRLAAYCNQVGAHYVTRPNRAGYKAGALNRVTPRLPPDVELIAVVDADYWVQPDFLTATVGHFIDPRLAFVQTPQDYRNGSESFLTRQYQRAEAYFYHAVMPSRNEQSAIIFCGTMGILRRRALEQVGGFAEDQICEDAEIGLRLAARGWESLYIGRSFGHGLMPSTFDAYKKQFHRWAFGNVRILFSRTGLILGSRMKWRQKVDFLVSNLHWFDGFFVVAIAAVLLFMALGPVFGYDAATHHQRELAFVALVPAFLLVDSAVRLHLVLARTQHVGAFDALRVQGMWMAIKFTNTAAALKCMAGIRMPFVRTPKGTPGRLGRAAATKQALLLCPKETVAGSLLAGVGAANIMPALAAGSATAVLLPVWLGLYALFFLCAPIYAYLSYRTLAS